MADAGTLINAGLELRGRLVAQEDVAVGGVLHGSLETSGHVSVRAGATLDAAVKGESLAVAGTLRGAADVVDYVSVQAGATVHSTLKAPRIVIERGARVTGRIEMDVPLPDGLG